MATTDTRLTPRKRAKLAVGLNHNADVLHNLTDQLTIHGYIDVEGDTMTLFAACNILRETIKKVTYDLDKE